MTNQLKNNEHTRNLPCPMAKISTLMVNVSNSGVFGRVGYTQHRNPGIFARKTSMASLSDRDLLGMILWLIWKLPG